MFKAHAPRLKTQGLKPKLRTILTFLTTDGLKPDRAWALDVFRAEGGGITVAPCWGHGGALVVLGCLGSGLWGHAEVNSGEQG